MNTNAMRESQHCDAITSPIPSRRVCAKLTTLNLIEDVLRRDSEAALARLRGSGR